MTRERDEPRSRWARRKELTRRRLLEAADALFSARGFEATTVEEIAEAADVAKGTFFNYFESKEWLLGELIHGHLEALFDAPAPPDVPVSERLRFLFRAMLRELKPYRHISRQMFAMALSRPQPETALCDHTTPSQAIAALIHQGQDEGLFRTDIAADTATMLLGSFFFRILMLESWEQENVPDSLEMRLEEGLDVVLCGLSAKAAD